MNKRILIFDDDKILLEILQLVLKDNGYEVEISETSHDIIERVSAFNPDLIIMDNYIPDIGGAEAIKLLKAQVRFDHIKIIFATASSNIIYLKNVTGADDYLRKPFDLNYFEKTVAKYYTDN